MNELQKLAELTRLVADLDAANGSAKHMGDLQDAVSDFVAKARVLLNVGTPTPVAKLGPDGKEWAKISAGYEYVDAVKTRADGFHGTAPWFHGWAVREAFVAGAEWQEKRGPQDDGATPGATR